VAGATLKAELRDRAGREGFDAVGVAAAEFLERDHVRLEEWLSRGRHAGMAWMARDPRRRSDPREILSGCRSVIVLAMNYWPGETQAAVPASRGRVALYARGRDYHRVLGQRLKRLTTWLEETSGQATRTFVDTGPLLERAWAERAGIGWIGKNANLITRRMGSWLLLGEILTRAELPPDSGPHADFCGSCNACLDACPTDAILEPGIVDSERCISYWTIEHRGPLPEQRRAGVEDWIFGCDACQDVCPWNVRFATPKQGDPFESRDELRGLDPAQLLDLDEAAFRARYSGSSLMRAKWEGMRRNAALVLGNRGSDDALPALNRATRDADPVVRSHAAWARERICRGSS